MYYIIYRYLLYYIVVVVSIIHSLSVLYTIVLYIHYIVMYYIIYRYLLYYIVVIVSIIHSLSVLYTIVLYIHYIVMYYIIYRYLLCTYTLSLSLIVFTVSICLFLFCPPFFFFPLILLAPNWSATTDWFLIKHTRLEGETHI